MRSDAKNVVCNDNTDSETLSFVGIIQFYGEKAATTFNANAIVLYPVHMVLMNFTREFHRFSIYNGHGLVSNLSLIETLSNNDSGQIKCRDRTSTASQPHDVPIFLNYLDKTEQRDIEIEFLQI